MAHTHLDGALQLAQQPARLLGSAGAAVGRGGGGGASTCGASIIQGRQRAHGLPCPDQQVVQRARSRLHSYVSDCGWWGCAWNGWWGQCCACGACGQCIKIASRSPKRMMRRFQERGRPLDRRRGDRSNRSIGWCDVLIAPTDRPCSQWVDRLDWFGRLVKGKINQSGPFPIIGGLVLARARAHTTVTGADIRST